MGDSWRRVEHRTHERVPTKEEADAGNGQAQLEARHQLVREQWIGVMETRQLREELRQCYMQEGVNHLKNCRELAVEYVKRIHNLSDAYKHPTHATP